MNNFKKLTLNDRYTYNAETGVILDLNDGHESRLEPRQKMVFDLLLENNHQLVSRELIEEKVWNNYGGANEGINQAVSTIRKALNDHDRSIISTIPKKGYILQLKIENEGRKQNLFIPSPKKIALLFFVVSVLAVIFYFVFKFLLINKSEDAL